MKFNKILGAFGNIDQILEGVKNKVFKNINIFYKIILIV